MNKIQLAKIASIFAVCHVMAAFMAQGQTLTTVANLSSKTYSLQGLIQANSGNLLGFDHGALGGEIVETGPSAKLGTIYAFCSQPNCADGEYPVGIFQAADGTIHGTTELGGANSKGALYDLSLDGKETVLYSFCSQPNCIDGWNPYSGPAPTVQGGVIGTTFGGGASGNGILYELTPAGKFSVLYSFCSQTNCTDGAGPVSPPFQTADGTIYGTTNHGGQNGSGTIYTYTPAGGLRTVYSFPGVPDGHSAGPTLTQGADGNFYGVTIYLGQAGSGSVFQFTPQGQFATLYSFCTTNCEDGEFPTGLIQGSNGNFYGMTSEAGIDNGGTIFEITTQGVLSTLASFCWEAECPDIGNGPQNLMQDTNGTFYGTTAAGGTLDYGTAFSLSVGLGPFAQANPGWGEAGNAVGILGSNLRGTTNVKFNGTAAEFKVISDTYIQAEVPTGASSGTIQVVSPSGALNSNFPFQVLP